MRSGTTSPTHPARTMDRSELASEPVACVALLRMAVFQRWWHNGAMPYQRAIYASDRRGTQRTARCKGRDKLPHRNHPTTKRKRTEQCDEWMRCDTTRHDTTRHDTTKRTTTTRLVRPSRRTHTQPSKQASNNTMVHQTGEAKRSRMRARTFFVPILR
jgi:hypothetical protein